MEQKELRPTFLWQEMFLDTWIFLETTASSEAFGVGFAIKMDDNLWYWRTAYGSGYENDRDAAMNATMISYTKGVQQDSVVSELLDDYS